jgi:hypothetical protein
MQQKNISLLILTILFACGCSQKCEFYLTTESVKSDCGFTESFSVCELTVYSMLNNYPDSFDIKQEYYCLLPGTGEVTTEVFYFKPSNEYQWMLRGERSDYMDVIPVKFKKENWYQLHTLTGKGFYQRGILFKFDKNGKVMMKEHSMHKIH